jgi:hypothetical protein
MDNNYRFQYVRHPLNHSRYLGVICFKVINDTLWASFSQCHPKDSFSKKVGRAIAKHRVDNNFTPAEVPQKLYLADGTRYCVTPITDTIQAETQRFYERNPLHDVNYN